MERVKLAEITLEQAFNLKGLQYTDGKYFNPIKNEGKWYISGVEVNECKSIEWVKKLTITDVELTVKEEQP
jgi:hypothetical protein